MLRVSFFLRYQMRGAFPMTGDDPGARVTCDCHHEAINLRGIMVIVMIIKLDLDGGSRRDY